MKGADKIINMRLNGRKPLVVNIFDYPISGELEIGDVVVYKIPIEKLDFRFAIDCLVCVYSDVRAKEIGQICRLNGAKQVADEPSKEIDYAYTRTSF